MLQGTLTYAHSSTPAWTAFITDNLLARDWASLEGRRTVVLSSLKRHVFVPRYSGPTNKEGKPLLEFITVRGMCTPAAVSGYIDQRLNPIDAQDFLDTINELREAYRQDGELA